MTDTTSTSLNGEQIAAKAHAQQSWTTFMREKNLQPIVEGWQAGHTPDGQPTLSGQVVGPGAAYALHRFAAEYFLVLGQAGDVRPQFDVDVPDRVALVWRSGGVWVELWHPDAADVPQSPTAAPGPLTAALPAAAPSAPDGRRGLLRGPSGRLSFTRKPKTPTT
jgi:hypothetical protein